MFAVLVVVYICNIEIKADCSRKGNSTESPSDLMYNTYFSFTYVVVFCFRLTELYLLAMIKIIAIFFNRFGFYNHLDLPVESISNYCCKLSSPLYSEVLEAQIFSFKLLQAFVVVYSL